MEVRPGRRNKAGYVFKFLQRSADGASLMDGSLTQLELLG